MRCKNCQHEIAYYNGKRYHSYEERTGEVNLSAECEFVLQDTEFEEENMRKLNEEIKKKYGEGYGSWYWFFEIHCLCQNPESELGKGEKK